MTAVHHSPDQLDSIVFMNLLHEHGFRDGTRLTLYEFWGRSAVKAGNWRGRALSKSNMDVNTCRLICMTIRSELSQQSRITAGIDWDDPTIHRCMFFFAYALNDALTFLTRDPPRAPHILPCQTLDEDIDPNPPYHCSHAFSAGSPTQCAGPCEWCAPLQDDDESDEPQSSEEEDRMQPGPPNPLAMCCAHHHQVRAEPVNPDPGATEDLIRCYICSTHWQPHFEYPEYDLPQLWHFNFS